MYSLKQRLHRNLLITVTLAMMILLTVLHLGIQALTQNYVASRLLHDADSIIAALMTGPNGEWRIQEERMSTVYHRVRSGHYYLVAVNQQRIRSRSLFDIDVATPILTLGENRCSMMDFLEQEQWLACSQAIEKQGNLVNVWVAEDISSLQDAQRWFMLFALISVVITILILLTTQYKILQKGFRQLERTRELIRQMHLGQKEVALQDLPLEIQPLVREIDRLLEQLGERVKRSRNALGNLAHALKRPLQRLHLQLETMSPAERQQSNDILQDIDSVVDRELKRARIVGVVMPGRHTQLDDDLVHLLQVMHSIYPEKNIETNYPEHLVLPHDRDDILELLGNLLDNACKFSQKRVLIQFEALDQGWRILVEDDGEGVSTEALHLIASRGVRLDENIQGHGLGLSICQDIVASYGGTMRFDQSGLGGLKVSIFLPEPNA